MVKVLTVRCMEGSLGAAVLKGYCVDTVGGPAVKTDTASWVRERAGDPEFRWYRGLMVRPNCLTAMAVTVGRFLFSPILKNCCR